MEEDITEDPTQGLLNEANLQRKDSTRGDISLDNLISKESAANKKAPSARLPLDHATRIK